jgi:anti-sigma factor RsiW
MKRHLSDDRLIELCVGSAEGGALEAHLTTCAECQVRHAELAALLGEVTDVSAAEADAAFPAERIGRQQARILQRIEQDGRPGRLITFPLSRPQEPLLVRSRPASRWVAVAAVAGLVVGLLTGQLLPVSRTMPPPARIVSNEAGAGMALRVVSTTLSEDEFLGQVEAAGSAGPAALRPLDALTPRAWEVAR